MDTFRQFRLYDNIVAIRKIKKMNTKPTLTVFTCTYNRAHTIGRTYESLCKQTSKDFIWLVVDDGSTDNTSELVKQWQKIDNEFEIQYAYKENGGLHTGYNKAIELMDSELCVCIDSDDWMPDDAVEKILSYWKEKGSDDVAGIVGLDFLKNNQPIGGLLPRIDHCHYYELELKYNYRNDNKIVIRVDLFKQVAPQPTYNGEKNFNPMYMIYKIDLDYEWIILNENLCFVDYQADGMTNGIFRQYQNSPNSFAALRILFFKFPDTSVIFKIKQYLHLCSSVCIARNFSWLHKSPHPLVAYLFVPLGYLLSLFIRIKAKCK